MGGPAELMCCTPNEAQANHWAAMVQAELLRIQKKYSRYLPTSLVSRINASAGKSAVYCDDETLSLFKMAKDFYDQSDGLFDITSGVLRKAWDLGAISADSSCQASAHKLDVIADRIAALKPLVGFGKVEFKGRELRLPIEGMELDFGGFGKEYASDAALTKLCLAGMKHGYINLAGDFRFAGPKPDGDAWQIGIQHPREPTSLLAIIPMIEGGLASSGDYERFIEIDGTRYCHILDPDTGWPVKGWQSVSVVAPTCVIAGFHATVAMLKQEQAINHLRNTKLPFLACDAFANIHRT